MEPGVPAGIRPQFGNRHLDAEDDVFQENAWDDVKWDMAQEEEALAKVAANSVPPTSDVFRDIEENAGLHWDSFYQVHEHKFFKDRHWLRTEFPELFVADTGARRILEVGCGVGNTIFPLLESNNDPQLYVYGCDISTTAVSILNASPQRDSARCSAFECDISLPDTWQFPFSSASLDFITLIFVLSALPPACHVTVIAELARYLKPGGQFLFRDYGRHDLAQLRFKPGRCLGENFYARGDNTRVYFFLEEDVRRLFVDNARLEEKQLVVDRRLLVNRMKKLKMYRVWIQAKFALRHTGA